MNVTTPLPGTSVRPQVLIIIFPHSALFLNSHDPTTLTHSNHCGLVEPTIWFPKPSSSTPTFFTPVVFFCLFFFIFAILRSCVPYIFSKGGDSWSFFFPWFYFYSTDYVTVAPVLPPPSPHIYLLFSSAIHNTTKACFSL